MCEWISVKDGNPPRGEKVYILRDGMVDHPATGHLGSDGFWRGYSGGPNAIELDDVSHWMSIPPLSLRSYPTLQEEPKYPLRERMDELEKKLGEVQDHSITLTNNLCGLVQGLEHRVDSIDKWVDEIGVRGLNDLEHRFLNHRHNNPQCAFFKQTGEPVVEDKE